MHRLLLLVIGQLFLLCVCAVHVDAAQEIDDAAFNQYLSDGKQEELEKLLSTRLAEQQASFVETYFLAVLRRSRFYKKVFADALPLLTGKIGTERETAVTLLIDIDQRVDTEFAFAKLTKLGESTADNSILWLSCIACRELRRNEVGRNLYNLLCQRWNPGPTLMHQTFANILDDLKDYNAALPHRIIVNQRGETSWGMNSYGNTLKGLKRYAEAEAAYRKALAIRPDTWTMLNLSNCLHDQGKFAEEKPVLESCLRSDDKFADAHGQLGRALVRLGDPAAAETEFRRALELDGTQAWIYENYEALARQTGQTALAEELKSKRMALSSDIKAAP